MNFTNQLNICIRELNNWIEFYEKLFNLNNFIDYCELDDFNNEHPFPKKLKFNFTLNINTIIKYYDYNKKYNTYYNILPNLKKQLEEHNNKIAKQKTENFKTLCGTIEEHNLDEQQIDSIIRENNNQLVVAGAGSGKTTTIIGKIKYLIQTNFCNPEEILLLSFTNASAEEMKKRVKKEIDITIDTYTFHKLGLEIIKKSTNEIPNIYNENELRKFIKNTLLELIKETEYLKKLIKFIIIGRYEIKEESEFKNKQEYEEFLTSNPPTTLKGEIVKSYGELEIANFLYINSINYEYEKEYKYKTTTSDFQQYKPDFYLPDHDIYIEYFGIDEKGEVAPYFKDQNEKSASELYNESIIWKRNAHKNNRTRMIETYYYDKKKNQLINKLEQELIKNNIILQPKNEAEIWDDINKKNNGIINEISKAFETIINLIKSNNYTIDDVIKKINYMYNQANTLLTIELIKPIYNLYNRYLKEHNEIDFNDMINTAVNYIKDRKYIHNYKYVIVDEYQDISKSRYNLLLAMRNTKNYKLFCVGDDWQSIYRFSGSDISLITKFEKYWGDTYTSKIERTYRFSNQLASISSNFIMKNPNQIRKNIRGNYSLKFPLSIINGYTEKNCLDFLEDRLLNFEQNSTVYFIGRYTYDLDIVKDNCQYQLKYNNKEQTTEIIYLKRKDLKIKFLTSHKVKGLQADYVVILNNKNTLMGFPCKINDLPIIELLLGQSDNYPYSEERRLFYVTITRARKKTFLLTNENNKSTFISELEKEYAQDLYREKYECPICNGHLIQKEGRYGKFWGCSNYPDCKYTHN